MHFKLRVLFGLFVVGFLYLAIMPATVAQSSSRNIQTRLPFGSSLKQPKDVAVQPSDHSRRKKSVDDGSVESGDTIHVDTTLAVFDVLVTNATQSQSIRGLSKNDFLVVEDGQPQQVSTFTLGNDATHLPRSIVLIVDRSMSQIPYLDASVGAAKMLINQLAASDQMAIVTDDVQLAADFTDNKKRLKTALDSVRKLTKGGVLSSSFQFSALLATLRELIDVEKRRPIIIFQTDGDEAAFLDIQQKDRKVSLKPYSLDDIYSTVEKSRVRIYTIIPSDRLIGIPESELMARGRQLLAKEAREWNEKYNWYGEQGEMPMPGSDASIKTPVKIFAQGQTAAAHVADISGGWTEFMEKPEQATEIYKRILSDINERYILSYYPTNKERDGRLRQVHIEVRGHPDYVVHGRESYYAMTN